MGLLSEGYLRLRFEGFIFGRAYIWGAYYRNFTVCTLWENLNSGGGGGGGGSGGYTRQC